MLKRLATSAAVVAAALPVSAASGATIAAAGDIACPAGSTATATTCAQQRTSNLIGTVNAVLPLGDNQYNSGALSDFRASYAPSWGRFNSEVRPVPGNHEYGTTGAKGYWDYFNGSGVTNGPAGKRGQGWYSYDLGSWHLIALNSECDQLPAGTCAVGGAQETFVRVDLAAHTNTCVLAYWHEPRFSLGSAAVKNAAAMAPIWNDLYDANADVILVGHKHNYQRSVPLNKSGARDDLRGMREIIVGTGGEDHSGAAATNSLFPVFNNTTFGVLKMTLGTGSFSWRFVHEANRTFTDSGSATCH